MNANRRPVAPVRKLVAAVVGTIAVFVMVFGLGMTSWPIVALGAAMLAFAVVLAMVNVVRRGARTWVAGTAHVTHASAPPPSLTFGRCELQVVVAAPGLPTSAVKVRDPRVPMDRWPIAGDTLPIMVDVDDMRRIRIQWAEVPTRTEAAMSPPLAYADPLDDYTTADDLLSEPDAPPWATRDRQWGRGGDDPESTADLDDPRADAVPEHAVLVHDAPGGGPVVLEGTLVDQDPRPGPLPRRPRPSPHPRPASAGMPAGTATATVDTGSRPTPPAEEPTLDAPTGPVAGPADPDLATTVVSPVGAATADTTTEVGGDPEIDLPLDGDARPTDPLAVLDPEPSAYPAPDDHPSDDNPDVSSPPAGLYGGAAWVRQESDVLADDRIDDVLTAYPSARPGPAGAIHGVGITVLVTDLDRSVAFYRDMLGFFEIDGGHGSAVLASGDTRLVLRTVHDLSPMTGRLIYLNLEVGDLDAIYEELQAKGVPFVHGPRPVNRGGRLELWAASFHDPDGHNIAITQWRARG